MSWRETFEKSSIPQEIAEFKSLVFYEYTYMGSELFLNVWHCGLSWGPVSLCSWCSLSADLNVLVYSPIWLFFFTIKIIHVYVYFLQRWNSLLLIVNWDTLGIWDSKYSDLQVWEFQWMWHSKLLLLLNRFSRVRLCATP